MTGIVNLSLMASGFYIFFSKFKVRTIKRNHPMFNSSNLEIKDKAWRRVGASPVLYKFSCWFAAPTGLFLKTQCYANQQETNNQETRCA